MCFNVITVISLAIFVACVSIPFLSIFIAKKDNSFMQYETLFNVKCINDINNLVPTVGYSIIHIDKVYMNDQIIQLGILLPVSQTVNQININQHYKFYQSYLDKRWDMAIVIATSMKTAWNNELKTYYDVMISRCRYYKINPPAADWNGVYEKI